MNHFILSSRTEFAIQDLKKCLSVVHLREVSSQQLRELQKQNEEQEEQDTGWLVGWLAGWLVGWLVG